MAQDYVINAGETLQWMNSSNLGGTIVQADKAVGIYSGNTYLRVASAENAGGGQDSAHQQLPHVQALSNEYVGPGIPTRKANMQPESVVYQVVGTVDGTTLSYDPAIPNGAPTALGLGQVAEFESTQLFTIRSQDEDHPFSFTQYMGGAINPNLGGCLLGCSGLGDEEWINLVAPGQYMRRYVFFVDPTYGVSSLAVVRTQGLDGFEDVKPRLLRGHRRVDAGRQRGPVRGRPHRSLPWRRRPVRAEPAGREQRRAVRHHRVGRRLLRELRVPGGRQRPDAQQPGRPGGLSSYSSTVSTCGPGEGRLIAATASKSLGDSPNMVVMHELSPTGHAQGSAGPAQTSGATTTWTLAS